MLRKLKLFIINSRHCNSAGKRRFRLLWNRFDQGHGKSDGLAAYITNFDDLVDDCSTHFTNICERKENKGKMRYLLGESMGGSMALLLHRTKGDYWDGAILMAPMCKEVLVIRKIHPCLQSFKAEFTASAPLTRIRDIAHRTCSSHFMSVVNFIYLLMEKYSDEGL